MSVSEKHLTKIGTKFVAQVDAPSHLTTIVFEDDGDTGYLYALAPTNDSLELLDALHIYNAEDNLRGADVQLEFLWTDDSSKAALRINAALWAVFDFAQETGWTRSNFPPPAGSWRMMEERPAWDDALIKQF